MWLVLAFLSAALLGFYDAFKKKALSGNAVIPVLFLNTLFSSLIFLPFIILSYTGNSLDGTMFHVAEGGWEVHKYIVLKSFIVLSSWIFGYFGMEHLPLTIVGNGSDLLVGDKGIRGVVVALGEGLSDITVDGTHVTAAAGALLSDVAAAAAEAGLTGMEPISGIPGSVGGACYMNAGAYGACMADVLESVRVYKPARMLDDGTRGSGNIIEFDVDELNLGYRKSRIADDGFIVLSATFNLAPGNAAMIKADMDDYRQRREDKQPLDMPSAGSTFKRPEGHFAGKLIMDAGLRGHAVGGAQVSEKHCGFIVNADHATAADVDELIRHIQATVKDQFGVDLEPEVHRVGEFL